jgi:hypothetical protein
VCTIVGTDTEKACHVDCAIAGSAACPTGYTCQSESVNGATRSLCVPSIGTCLDSVGGYCDRVGIPQPCSRSNAAGSCVGQRTCDQATNRYDACNATAPQFKTDCSQQDPAGCTLQYAGTATQQVTNCGSCGNICPGLNQTGDVVTCNNATLPATCTFACNGEYYDVNNSVTDGCEVLDNPQSNHDSGHDTNWGSFGASDDDFSTTITGMIPSDQRTHTPAVAGFNAADGYARDYLTIKGTGSCDTFICENDIDMKLQINGGHGGCYMLTVITDKSGTQTCATNGNGFCEISDGSGSYSDGDQIVLIVDKTCSSATIESVSYGISGHL